MLYGENTERRLKLVEKINSILKPSFSEFELNENLKNALDGLEKSIKNEKASIESAPPALFMPNEWQTDNNTIFLCQKRISELKKQQNLSSHKIEMTLESATRAYLIPYGDLCQDNDDIDEDVFERPNREKLVNWIKDKGPSARYIPLQRINKFKDSLRYKNFNWSDFDDQKTILYIEENTLTQQRKLSAIEVLRRNVPYLSNLRSALDGSLANNFSKNEADVSPIIQWKFLTDESRSGCGQQRKFVKNALDTCDFSFLWGPPGSGKTTAICELIAQLASKGKKVLLCASTHVAVDNVIEKLAEFKLCAKPDSKESLSMDVIPLRIASDPSNVSHIVQPYIENVFIDGETNRLIENLKRNTKYRAAKRLLESINDGMDTLAPRLAYESANLICGTTMGFMQYEELKNSDISSTPAFDYIILDECSKTTLDEFLVPAVYASKWILVGDPYQLFPYSEDEDAVATICKQIDSEISEFPEIRRKVESFVNLAQEEQMLRLEGASKHHHILTRMKDELSQILSLSPGCHDAIKLTLSVKLCSVLEQFTSGNAEIPVPYFKLIKSLPKEIVSTRLTKLSYQHRMDPSIADFPSRVIYNGKSMLTNLVKPMPIFHIQARVVKREIRRTTPFNLPDNNNIERISAVEGVLVMAEILLISRWIKDNKPIKKPSIYVIAFYKNQIRLLEHSYKILKKKLSLDLDVVFHTVDSCQGHEADIVILSFAMDSKKARSSFIRSFNRVNVALTRAKSHLIFTRLPPKDGSNDIVDKLNDELITHKILEGNLDIAPEDFSVSAVLSAIKEMSINAR